MHKGKYILTEKNRHGKTVYYARIGSGRRIRLPDIADEAFASAHKSAIEELAKENIASVMRNSELQKNNMIRKSNAAIRRCVASARQRARAKGMDFDLSTDWAILTIKAQKYKCSVSGVHFFEKKWQANRSPYSPSIDRIDPSRGYTKDNVRIVLTAVNLMMMEWGESVIADIAFRVKVRRSIPERAGNAGNYGM